MHEGTEQASDHTSSCPSPELSSSARWLPGALQHSSLGSLGGEGRLVQGLVERWKPAEKGPGQASRQLAAQLELEPCLWLLPLHHRVDLV